MVDAIPFISQFKSLIQVMSGDKEGARRTQENFSKQAPIISQSRSLVEAAMGNPRAARQTQEEFVDGFDNIPGVGHIKGGIHYAQGNKEKGDNAMKAATRTVATIGEPSLQSECILFLKIYFCCCFIASSSYSIFFIFFIFFIFVLFVFCPFEHNSSKPVLILLLYPAFPQSFLHP